MYYPGIVDTHAHYDDPCFSSSLEDVLLCQNAHGVTHIINAASTLASARRSLELAAAYPFVYAAVGIHPQESETLPHNAWQDELEELARSEKSVAIGEIGLDYADDTPVRDLQKEVFSAQLEIARRLQMPVQIHDRNAHGDVMDLLRHYKPSGCLHRFSGSVEMGKEAVRMGLALGIGGALTYSNSKKERAVVREIPLEFLLLETDCPYLAPQQYRGQVSTSDMLWIVADLIAEIKGNVTAQQVVQITAQNARRIFGIP